MAAAAVESAGVNIPSNFIEKYNEERDKRLKASKGAGQFIDINRSEKYKHFGEDPWISVGTPINHVVSDGGHVKALIVGAGFSALLNAVKLLKAGFKLEDLLLVDPAGGFGGTWYFNRFPGLMCDVESYIYMPLLEETGYVPKKKYASGEELRQYTELLAGKFDLHQRAMFQTSAKEATWNDAKGEWDVLITQKPKSGPEKNITVHAQFVILTSGPLNRPHLPNLKGIEEYKGHAFHTSRWDYAYTGGSNEKPELTGLEGKRVGIIGTGATAIQVVPQLAKYAKDLYVFQRTPSSVDWRNNYETKPEVFHKEIANKPGWQRERNENFAAFMSYVQPLPEVDMVNDAWTRAHAYAALIGGPNNVTMDTVQQFVGEKHKLDYPRQEGIRQRTAQIVKDPETAEKLKAWYPVWCKRPCFHDEYLPSFNQPNVHLVDTNGEGIREISAAGPIVDGKEYPVDVLVWATGYESPAAGSPADKCGITVTGKDGFKMSEKAASGLTTLHGVISNGFPNLFWPGLGQIAATVNFTFTLETLSDHISYIISHTAARATSGDRKPSVQPTPEAEEIYAKKIMSQGLALASVAGCTPSYYNMEGEADKMTREQKMKAARLASWANGFLDYTEMLGNWEKDGSLEGLEITAA